MHSEVSILPFSVSSLPLMKVAFIRLAAQRLLTVQKLFHVAIQNSSVCLSCRKKIRWMICMQAGSSLFYYFCCLVRCSWFSSTFVSWKIKCQSVSTSECAFFFFFPLCKPGCSFHTACQQLLHLCWHTFQPYSFETILKQFQLLPSFSYSFTRHCFCGR